MKFNYSYEKGKFEAEWTKLRDDYRAAGMDEAAIEAMCEFDWSVFKSERTYRRHNQELPFQCFEDDGEADDENTALFSKFRDSFSVPANETDPSRWDQWIDEIDNRKLCSAISALSARDKELMTLHFFEGYTVTEIAQMQGVSRPTISKKVIRIKNYLKNFAMKATD